ncbi:FAD-dependent oxidoreductase [Microbacterium sp. Re1]|uniref:FAD-dependent oxidoreductase n=1 Tax=Microbacterium commune TaxID=2762219 RepID=A0ABR8W3F8_9MICO|nr:FAD-dependent oxidoreductase [Microbacterium commune]MBD8011554.1 FAD-dependent oxidoreductase [Microbacterium commune]
MSITRRTLLVGAGAGAVGLLLSACTPEPQPAPTRTRTPMPRPTAPEAVPAPAGWLRSTWATDPYSHGSTSYLPAGADPTERQRLAEPVLDRLFFAGEATDSDHPGTLVGAVDDARRAALALISASDDTERLAIVGAGAAGVIAARMLADAGHEVTLFEAREHIGGRIRSIADDEQWPIPPQLGAWLLSEADLASLDGRLVDLGDRSLALDTATTWNAEGETEGLDGAPIAQAVEKAQAQASDAAITDALAANGADLDDPALSASLAWMAAMTGADPSRASSWYPPHFPGDGVHGMIGDLDAYLGDQLEGVKVATASPVARIAYDDRGVSLRLGTGEALSYDRVIVTAPLGVLQKQGIEFAPALPFSHRGAIAALASGFIETAWMRFDEAFWTTEATIWHVAGGDALIRTWLNLQPFTGEPVLVGLVGGADAERFAELSERDATAAARASLAFFAAPADDEG